MPPELLTRLAGLLAENRLSIETVLAPGGSLTAADGSHVRLAPHDQNWRDISLLRNGNRDDLTEVNLTPAAPIPADIFRVWFPALTEIVGKSHVPRRFLVDLNVPGQFYRVRLVARVERDAITEITLLREKRG